MLTEWNGAPGDTRLEMSVSIPSRIYGTSRIIWLFENASRPLILHPAPNAEAVQLQATMKRTAWAALSQPAEAACGLRVLSNALSLSLNGMKK
jgi:hypothetical protein